VSLAPILPLPHKPGSPKNPQVFGHSRLRDPSPRGKRTDGLLAVKTKPFKNTSPGRVGKAPEKNITDRGSLIHSLLVMYGIIT